MKFLLPILALSSLASAQKEARFVRIELPGKGRTLTLAEVEVMSDGKNIGRSGKASQSTTSNNAGAERAIDGNKSPSFSSAGQTHTVEGKKDAWWEVDLGKMAKIDAISVWNRNEGDLGKRLDGFTLSLLDAQKKEVFTSKSVTAPETAVIFNLKKGADVVYAGADGKIAKTVSVPLGHRDPVPFKFEKGDTVAIIGNGLADRMQHDGWSETLIQSATPGMELKFRHMGLTGDRPNKYPRSRGFTPMPQYLQQVGADVIIAMFGYNESFDLSLIHI